MTMEKSDLGNIMDTPSSITAVQLEALRRERDAHPYSAPLQVVSLMADKLGGTPLWETQTMPRVALYMMDAGRLDSLLDGCTRQPAAHEVKPPTIRQESVETVPVVEAEGEFDILKEINAYQEVSFKTAPKSVILSNFLEKDGGIRLEEMDFEEVSVQDLAKKSIQSTEPLETETMAVILMRQGKVDAAVAIYRKLISKYPEKSSIFAARIEEAESLREK